MSNSETLCTFHVDDLFFGIEVSRVQEVLRHQTMTRVPLAADVVKGLMNLRGQIVTALDMRKLLKLSQPPADWLAMNVLIRTGDCLVSLLVDEIGDVIEVNPEQFEDTPETLPQNVKPAIKGVYKLNGQLLLLLDTDKLEIPTEAASAMAWAG